MDTQNTSRQFRYLEEVRIPLHRAGFGTLPLEGDQLPVHWNGTPLCRITGKGSVFYRREDADTPQAEAALYRVVTWDWDYDRTGVSHGHYFMEKYDEAFASMEKRYAGCEPS